MSEDKDANKDKRVIHSFPVLPSTSTLVILLYLSFFWGLFVEHLKRFNFLVNKSKDIVTSVNDLSKELSVKLFTWTKSMSQTILAIFLLQTDLVKIKIVKMQTEIDINYAFHNLDDLKLIHSLDLVMANWNRLCFFQILPWKSIYWQSHLAFCLTDRL